MMSTPAHPDMKHAVPTGQGNDSRLRILHVLFSPRMAGSERYCVDLANGQAEAGHEVHVVGTHGSPLAAALSPAVAFHGLRTRLFRGFRLRRLLSALRIDIGHAHLSPACKALATAPATVTRIATLHVGYKPKQHRRLDGLIAVNRAQMARMGDYPGKVCRIPNWMPDAAETVNFDLRQQLGLPPHIRLVGAVGRLHRSKGCDLLIEAFGKAAPQDAALVLAGDGPQRDALETLARGVGRVHFLGYCAHVPGFLRNLDLFVSPSREETAGLAILEAMREGLPVISTATEGPLEYLENYPVTLVQPGSAEALTGALQTALDPGNIAGLKRLCYDLHPFSRTTGVANVVQFYRHVAGVAGALAPDAPSDRRLSDAEQAEK